MQVLISFSRVNLFGCAAFSHPLNNFLPPYPHPPSPHLPPSHHSHSLLFPSSPSILLFTSPQPSNPPSLSVARRRLPLQGQYLSNDSPVKLRQRPWDKRGERGREGGREGGWAAGETGEEKQEVCVCGVFFFKDNFIWSFFAFEITWNSGDD